MKKFRTLVFSHYSNNTFYQDIVLPNNECKDRATTLSSLEDELGPGYAIIDFEEITQEPQLYIYYIRTVNTDRKVMQIETASSDSDSIFKELLIESLKQGLITPSTRVRFYRRCANSSYPPQMLCTSCLNDKLSINVEVNECKSSPQFAGMTSFKITMKGTRLEVVKLKRDISRVLAKLHIEYFMHQLDYPGIHIIVLNIDGNVLLGINSINRVISYYNKERLMKGGAI